MYALTLHEPWPWAFLLPAGLPGVHMPPVTSVPPKRVENRTWPPPQAAIGQLIALHAGLHYDQAGADWMKITFGIFPPTRGQVEASRLIERVSTWNKCDQRTGTVFAVARIARVDTVVSWLDKWACGPYAWRLEDFVAITPVPVPGRQGLWRLPAEIKDQVMRALGEAQPREDAGR